MKIMKMKMGAKVEYFDIADDGDEEGHNSGSHTELLQTESLALGSSSAGGKKEFEELVSL